MIRTEHVYHISGFSVGNNSHAPMSSDGMFNTVHLFPSGNSFREYIDTNLEGKENEPLMLSSSSEFRPTMLACKNTLAIVSIPYDVAEELRETVRLYGIDRVVFKELEEGRVVAVGLAKGMDKPVVLRQIVQLTFWDSAVTDTYSSQLSHCIGKLDIQSKGSPN